MSKFRRNTLLLTCMLAMQLMKPVTSIYAKEMILTYDGKQHTYNKPPITLEIDDRNIPMDMPPVQLEGTTLVPTREVFEPMGASVEWKPAEKKVYVNHGDKLIILEVDKSVAWVEGKTKNLNMPPKIINGKLMLPLRFIGETLGYKVDWNQETSHIKINQIKTAPEVKPPVDVAPTLTTEVKDIEVREMGEGIVIYTINLSKPGQTYSTFTQVDKVVVDIDSAKNSLQSRMTLQNSPYVEAIRTSQFTSQTSRVVFDLNREVDSKVEFSNDKRSIMITMQGKGDLGTQYPDTELPGSGLGPEIKPPVIENVEYDNIEYTNNIRETLSFKKVPGLSKDNIKIKDDYRNRKIIVTLPNNYQELYPDGIMNIGNPTIDRVVVKSGDKTEFTIHENTVLAYDIIEDEENITLVFMRPKEKYGKIILLDMGHGGRDGGASANGLIEKQLNYEQGMGVYNLLKQDPNIKVYITREDDSYPTNPDRAKLANDIGADIFVSMHNNSVTTSTPNGTEILYSTKDPRSKEMAEILQRNMVSRLGTFDRKTKPRPGLVVLNSTNMPAVLVETAFITNPVDAERLKSPEFNRLVSRVVYDSIVEIFNTLSFR